MKKTGKYFTAKEREEVGQKPGLPNATKIVWVLPLILFMRVS